ncbi:hypothetical protein ACGFT2_01885 [Streptomyces sp. NPDC048514]|uniref:hypothetical protein n=1 Tax=Streptomyces sp. NPDC048514 TaxID=3365564 RepID=UPI0037242D44
MTAVKILKNSLKILKSSLLTAAAALLLAVVTPPAGAFVGGTPAEPGQLPWHVSHVR